MPRDTTRRRLLAGVAAAGSASLAGCAGATPFVGRRLEETEELDPDGADAIAIAGSTGELVVAGSDRETVLLDVEKQSSSIRTDLEELRLRTERGDGIIELEAAYEGELGWFESEPTMNLDVALPRELSVDRLSTAAGLVEVTDVTGDLEAEATTGAVHLEAIDGTVTAETSTGEIRVRDVSAVGDLTASTGRIDAAVPAIDGDTEIAASTGEVDVAVAPDLDAELVVDTSVGDVSVEGLDLADESRSATEISGTLGDGGPTLLVETSTGNVSVTALE